MPMIRSRQKYEPVEPAKGVGRKVSCADHSREVSAAREVPRITGPNAPVQCAARPRRPRTETVRATPAGDALQPRSGGRVGRPAHGRGLPTSDADPGPPPRAAPAGVRSRFSMTKRMLIDATH